MKVMPLIARMEAHLGEGTGAAVHETSQDDTAKNVSTVV